MGVGGGGTKNLYLSGISKELRGEVLRVYLNLTSTELLSRCVKKRTQNPNESLHSKLWRRCLKIKDAKLVRKMAVLKTFDFQLLLLIPSSIFDLETWGLFYFIQKKLTYKQIGRFLIFCHT